MKILAIETSCDETGIAIMHNSEEITLLGNALATQIELHAQYGGVFPAMAKRAHAEKFVPLLTEALKQANMLNPQSGAVDTKTIDSLCEKDAVLKESFTTFFNSYGTPDIDAIAVTTGPGLEPALWVGITAAKVLAALWNKPLIPINHMEGHVMTALVQKDGDTFTLPQIQYPVLALLVSGGHTELVLSEQVGQYTKIGQTRDDAVGEAFDKVARMLGLPYPGGPAVSKLAAQFRASGASQRFTLPRPMLHSKDYDFSFSGIKTAVLYTVRDLAELTEENKLAIAAEFEDAVVEVLIKKTLAAAEEYHVQTIAVGGGVAGNSYLKNTLAQSIQSGVTLHFPEAALATDNAVMIGLAACLKTSSGVIPHIPLEQIKAQGNLSIATQ